MDEGHETVFCPKGYAWRDEIHEIPIKLEQIFFTSEFSGVGFYRIQRFVKSVVFPSVRPSVRDVS